MKPVLYISTFFLTLGLLASCSNSVSMGDRESNVKDGIHTTPTEEPKPNDIDGDGVLDENDNCPTLANTDQADSDGDGEGDICEDLECASNVCQDNGFLSGYHCDGDFSVGCSTQGDGCLAETSRMNCSEGCQTTGDQAGSCIPKPRDLTDPLIDSASGTMTHGSTITMTGEDFGEHDLNIEWTGSKIESTAVGTNPRELGEHWTHYQLTGTAQDDQHITDEKSWSGNKSIDLTVNYLEMCEGTCGARLSYDIPQGEAPQNWTKIFISYWYRIEGVARYGSDHKWQDKHLWITDNNVGDPPEYPAPFGTVRNAQSHQCALNSETGLNAYYKSMPHSWHGCSGLEGFPMNEAFYPPTSSIGYNIASQDYFKIYNTRGANAHISEYAFNNEEWVRLDYYYDLGSYETHDGEQYIATFRPEGQGTQYGFDPGLLIGKWYENVKLITDRTDGCTAPYTHPNIVGFYLFTRDPTWVRNFLDDVYIQVGTRSRVILGNDPNYEESTKQEIQYPTAWSDGEIKIELNYGGSFKSGDTAYLYVINENEYDQGDRDAYGNGHYDFAGISPGYPITLE